MPNKTPRQLALERRKELLALDARMAAEILAAYRAIERHLAEQIRGLRLLLAQPAGTTPEKLASLLAQKSRFAQLQQQIVHEIWVMSHTIAPQITAAQSTAVELGASHAAELMQAAIPATTIGVEFNAIDFGAVKTFVGLMGDGTPIFRYFVTVLSKDAAIRVREALLMGLVTGQGADAIARQLKDALNGNRARAQTIARTEITRAYRKSAIEEYLANDDVVEGWVWTAARDGRTCAVCWAMDGQFFENDQPFESHVNCRCVARPQSKTFAELGIESTVETRAVIEPGEEAFAKLPADRQLEILGPAKYEAYKSGKLRLRDLVGFKSDRTWGGSRFERSLADALAGPDKRAFPVPKKKKIA